MKHVPSKLKRILVTATVVASGAWATSEAQVSAPKGEKQQDEGTQAAERTQVPMRVSTITSHPKRLVGRTLTVVGEVDDVEGARVFKLDDNAPFRAGIDDELVVVSARDASWQATEEWDDDAWVRVTGTLLRREDPAFKNQIGDLGPDLERVLEGHEVVLVAQSAERIQ